MGDSTVLKLIYEAGFVVKLVLLVLLFFSVFSWAIILYKFKFLSKIERETEEFHRAFRKSKDWDSLHQSSKKFSLSPSVNLFRSAHSAKSKEGINRDDIKRNLKRIESLETARLSKYLTFLATTGSTTPFIGLFGTVWGIMNSFLRIEKMGSAALSAVAPGISEALIATAAGLAAAIPAVIAYNYYLSRVRRNIIVMEDFSQELIDHCMR